MLGLGCTVDRNHFGAHVRRPVSALLAALCQFGFLPLLAFLLALAFSWTARPAGAPMWLLSRGNLSNLMSLLVDGDIDLRYRSGYLIGVNRVYSHGFKTKEGSRAVSMKVRKACRGNWR